MKSRKETLDNGFYEIFGRKFIEQFLMKSNNKFSDAGSSNNILDDN